MNEFVTSAEERVDQERRRVSRQAMGLREVMGPGPDWQAHARDLLLDSVVKQARWAGTPRREPAPC